ncbi:MAG: oligosaccharide flippase family protein [Nitrospirae bacterium]|nr:oligosaccharide flippase family protein [Nitrospirota bacterium]MBI3593457.1 oligosaccharide flippase family protein [Nitrospirota bacterium]
MPQIDSPILIKMPINRLKLNFISNICGQIWSGLMIFAFTPIYIRFVGIESYGLFGFYVMVQGSIQVLDLGMTQTMNREMARYSAVPDKAGETRDFVRTMEVCYWIIGIVIGVILWIVSPMIAKDWIRAESITIKTVQNIIMIMSIVLTLQWPISLYHGGLLGLQRHPELNVLKMCMSTLSGGGAVIILWLVSPTIMAFFIWQIVVTILHLFLSKLLLQRNLPMCLRKSKFSFELIQNVWHFAAGMSGITISAIILTQLDKIILSKMLTLKIFGYYSLASTLGSGLLMFITPVFNTIYPRLSYLVALGDQAKLKHAYHLGSQVMAVLILPLALTISYFSFDILFLWTSSREIAQYASNIVSVLIIGTALNGLMNLPYALQLANGWTSIGLKINTFFIIIFIPMIYFLTRTYGPIGAASVWVILNGLYMIIGVPLTHQKLLKGESWEWFSGDIFVTLVATFVATFIARQIFVSPMVPFVAILNLGITFIFVYSVGVLATPVTRSWALNRFLKKR